MKLIVEEYGRVMIGVMISFVLLIGVFSGFVKKWREFGGINDSIKTNFQSDEVKRTAPVIYAGNFKVGKGEDICFEKYISAYDFDGRDITEDIEIACDLMSDGKKTYENMVYGYKDIHWDRQGIFHCNLQVKSAVTGKTAMKKIIVLVDCPESPEGRSKVCG